MSDSKMDEIFKNKLPGHESPVPEDMWERIIRKKENDRKGFFFFLRLSGLFILGFGIAWFLLFGFNRNPANQGAQKITNGKDKTVPDIANTKTNDQDLVKANAPGNQTTRPVLDSLQRNNNLGVYKGNDISKVHTQKKAKKKAYTNNGNSTDPAGTRYRQKNYANSITLKKNEPADIQSKQSGKNSDAHLAEAAAAATIGNLSDQTANSTSSSNSTLLSADSAHMPIVKKSDSTVKSLAADSVLKTMVKKSDSVKKAIRGKWSLDIYASPDYPIFRGEPYVESKFSYTVGLRIEHSFGKRFSGKIGIQFSQINFKFSDSSGYVGPNHLMSLDLPVLAGYSWGNETLGMTINTGVVFNLYSWPHSNSPSYFKTNTGLSLYLGFNVKKQISNRIDIFTEPFYRYQLSPMTVSSVYYGKFIDVVGLSFGARYHFKK